MLPTAAVRSPRSLGQRTLTDIIAIFRTLDPAPSAKYSFPNIAWAAGKEMPVVGSVTVAIVEGAWGDAPADIKQQVGGRSQNYLGGPLVSI